MMKRPVVLGVIAAMFAVAIAAQSRQPAGTSHNGKAFRFNKVRTPADQIGWNRLGLCARALCYGGSLQRGARRVS